MPYIASMGIYVVSKDVMLDLLREKFPGANDFGSEVIPGATSIGMRVSILSFSHFFKNAVLFIAVKCTWFLCYIRKYYKAFFLNKEIVMEHLLISSTSK